MITKLGLAALFLLAAQPQDSGVLLRRAFAPNTSDAYSVETKMSQHTVMPGGMGEQDIDLTTTMKFVMKYGKVSEDGSAELRIEASDIKHDSSTPMPTDLPSGFTATGKIDNRYLVSELKAESADPQIVRMVDGVGSTMQQIHLPEKPVKPGDSWIWETPKIPALANQSLKMNVKFMGERTEADKTYHVLEIDDTIPLDVDMAKAMEAMGQQAPAEMHMKGNAKMKLQTLLEKGTGRIYSTAGTTVMDMVLTVAQLPGDITSHVEVTTAMKLVE